MVCQKGGVWAMAIKYLVYGLAAIAGLFPLKLHLIY